MDQKKGKEKWYSFFPKKLPKLHLWTTPNGYKPLIMLEEIGADFELIKVPLDGTQKKPDYVKLNPNGRIPTL